MKRRDILKGLAIATGGVTLAQSIDALGHESDDSIANILFVQNSEGASLKGGVLTLQAINADTLYFSDRPNRIVGRVATEAFVDHWDTGEDNFKSDPPNAVLSILGHPEPQDIVVVLRNPRLDGNNLVYDTEVLDGSSSVEGKATALFIDAIGHPMAPRSGRRTKRRVVHANCDDDTLDITQKDADCD